MCTILFRVYLFFCIGTLIVTNTLEEQTSYWFTPLLGTRNRRQVKQSSSQAQGPCVLPPYPDQGTYVVSNVPNATPGQSFGSFMLTVRCRRGFGFLGSDDGTDGTVTQQVYCVNGVWSQTVPKCIRFCELKPHHSVRYQCNVKDGGYRSCKKYLPPGTSVNPVCRGPIYTSARNLPYMNCRSGFWDYVAECQAECGQVTPVGTQLVIGGKKARRGELPWHVAVYYKSGSSHRQICGGSLVANNVVISAAHCFWDDLKKLLPASDYAVAVGKIYRAWNSDNDKDVDVQKSDVQEIKIPYLFHGATTNFQEDIAVVIAATSFTYKLHIRPVCLHFDANFDRRQLQHGRIGKVAGWGLTATDGKASPVLKVVDLPYVSLDTCYNEVPASFREHLTADKFCAGYANGTALCRGDSGGGLAFAAFTELDIERYYLRGVVSAAPHADDQCNAHVYTAFTRITKHEDLIKEALVQADRSCHSYQFRCNDGACVDRGTDCDGIEDCADGSDEAKELCHPYTESAGRPVFSNGCTLPPFPEHGSYKVTNVPNARPGQLFHSLSLTITCEEGYLLNQTDAENDSHQISCVNGKWMQDMPECVEGNKKTYGLSDECGEQYYSNYEARLPWHVGIYFKEAAGYTLVCGGSIVTPKFVISVTGCFTLNRKNPFKYAVAAGKVLSNWNDDVIVHPQTSDVQQIYVSYQERPPRHKDNIAIAALITPFVFSSSVKPVCLNLEEEFAMQHLKEDILGKTVAWPLISRDQGEELGVLQTIDISFLNFETCSETVPPEADDFIKNKICTGYPKSNDTRVILAGSGLVYPDESGRYFLIGVKVNTVECGQDCVKDVASYNMFTKVYRYKGFLKEHLWITKVP